MKRMIMAGLLMVAMAGAVHAGRRSGGYWSRGSGSNQNSTYVKPSTRSDGTQVDGHWRTKPNSTESDNYGTRGNYNPHKGTYGTKSWDDNN